MISKTEISFEIVTKFSISIAIEEENFLFDHVDLFPCDESHVEFVFSIRAMLKNRRDIQGETKDSSKIECHVAILFFLFFSFFFSTELIIFRPFNNFRPPFAEASACGSTQSVPSYRTVHSRMLYVCNQCTLRAHACTLLYIRFRESHMQKRQASETTFH